MVEYNPVPSLKAAMREAIRLSASSREQIADEMNRLADRAGIAPPSRSGGITVPILDKWVAAGSPNHVIPLRLLPLFCRAAGSLEPLRVYSAAFAGAACITTEELRLLEWAKAELASRRAKRLARKKAQEVGIE